MKVKLIAHTPEPEKTIAAAAKLCYSQVGTEDLLNKLDEESTAKFLDRLVSMGHESPIEHVSFTFAVEGVSRVLTHQLVRHRIASYSQQSQRYVKLEQFEYIIPPSIEKMPAAKEKFIKAMKNDQEAYNEITKDLFEENYKRFLQEGKTEKEAKQMAEKASIEDARYVFPNACETKIVFTMNARTLFHFLNERCCERAQWEIRNMAEEVAKQLKGVAPILFKNVGPNCVNGPCPEGDMSCGKMKQMREKYAALD